MSDAQVADARYTEAVATELALRLAVTASLAAKPTTFETDADRDEFDLRR